jgi:TolB protein
MTRSLIRISLVGAALLLSAAASAAQPGTPAATVIAIPPITTPDTGVKGNEMLGLGWQATELIAADLRQTSEMMPLPPSRKDYYSYPEVTAPTFSKWRAAGA